MPTTIAVFNQPGLNGGGVGDSSDENANLLSIIQKSIDDGEDYVINNNIVNFTDTANLQAQLNNSSFFFMTDMESADPTDSSFLPPSAITILHDFVDGGGVIVQTGTAGNRDVQFLNTIFDLNLTSASAGSWDKNTANTAGTNFDSGPASLLSPSATDSINADSITNGVYTSYYDTGSDANSVLGQISYGDGVILFTGFDYFNAGFATDWGEGLHSDGGQNTSDYVTFGVPAMLSTATGFSNNSEAVSLPAVSDGGVMLLTLLMAGVAGWFLRRAGRFSVG
jgi:hypothetical protein